MSLVFCLWLILLIRAHEPGNPGLIGLEEGVDAVALSFVRTADDVLACRKIIEDRGGNVPIIAKIEKHEAVDNIDSIIAVSQAIMVARSDLRVEIDIESLPFQGRARAADFGTGV